MEEETNVTVQLITHTPEPERLVAAAAKLCYSNANMQDVLAISSEDAAKFIANCRRRTSRRWSM